MATPSVEKTVRSQALPQISFRAILAAVTATVFLAWLIRQALADQQWAIALLFPVAAGGLYFAVSFVLFVVAWIPAVVVARRNSEAREGNPFAADQLPPQILPPKGS